MIQNAAFLFMPTTQSCIVLHSWSQKCLQNEFNSVQEQLCQLQLVLNADKTKHVFHYFSINKVKSVCSTFKYLGSSAVFACLSQHIFGKQKRRRSLYLEFTSEISPALPLGWNRNWWSRPFLWLLIMVTCYVWMPPIMCWLECIMVLRYITNCGALSHRCVIF